MPRRRSWLFLLAAAFVLFPFSSLSQQPPPASSARTLILPRRIVSGEHATLAVLDLNGRLTPGVTVRFSNGDHYVTDTTGRARFVAPLDPGVLLGSIANRSGKVPTTILTREEALSSTPQILSVPRIASVTDRFEITGVGFCGDADANQVTIGSRSALVLASSPGSLVVLPPADLEPGSASVAVSCANHSAASFSLNFVELSLEADASPLAPGERRQLVVRVRGTNAKLSLEARNLAPDVAEIAGGNPVRIVSTGGTQNFAQVSVVGRKRGSFLISIRLLSSTGSPLP